MSHGRTVLWKSCKPAGDAHLSGLMQGKLILHEDWGQGWVWWKMREPNKAFPFSTSVIHYPFHQHREWVLRHLGAHVYYVPDALILSAALWGALRQRNWGSGRQSDMWRYRPRKECSWDATGVLPISWRFSHFLRLPLIQRLKSSLQSLGDPKTTSRALLGTK